MQVYAATSGDDYIRDSAAFPGSKPGSVYPGSFYMQGVYMGKYNYAEVCATSKNPISPSRNVMLILIGTYYVHTDMLQTDY